MKLTAWKFTRAETVQPAVPPPEFSAAALQTKLVSWDALAAAVIPENWFVAPSLGQRLLHPKATRERMVDGAIESIQMTALAIDLRRAVEHKTIDAFLPAGAEARRWRPNTVGMDDAAGHYFYAADIHKIAASLTEPGDEASLRSFNSVCAALNTLPDHQPALAAGTLSARPVTSPEHTRRPPAGVAPRR